MICRKPPSPIKKKKPYRSVVWREISHATLLSERDEPLRSGRDEQPPKPTSSACPRKRFDRQMCPVDRENESFFRHLRTSAGLAFFPFFLFFFGRLTRRNFTKDLSDTLCESRFKRAAWTVAQSLSCARNQNSKNEAPAKFLELNGYFSYFQRTSRVTTGLINGTSIRNLNHVFEKTNSKVFKFLIEYISYVFVKY